MIYVYHVALAAMVFLVMLNGLLRVRKKARVGANLVLILLGLLVAGFVAFGWVLGVLAVVLVSVVYPMVVGRLASATARRLLK